MLGIGIIALLSLGLVGLVVSGGDEDVVQSDPDNTSGDTSELATQTGVTEPAAEGPATQPNLAVEGPKASEEPAETPPTRNTIERVFPAPDTTAEADAAEEERDFTPEQQANNLVTVLAAEGAELADERVVVDGPSDGIDSDRDFVVRSTEDTHSLAVGYDHDLTFAIERGANTKAIDAALNSNIKGVDGETSSVTKELIDAEGATFSETLVTKDFANHADIMLQIDQSQVGSHVAEIDLSNPDDTLRFHFTNMSSNVHIVYNEQPHDEEEASRSVLSAYVIETPQSVTNLSANLIDRIIEQDGTQGGLTKLIAHIHLGEDSVSVAGDGSSDAPYTQVLTDFINDKPNILSNIRWASIGNHDGGDAPQTTHVARVEAPQAGSTIGSAGSSGTFGLSGLQGTALNLLSKGGLDGASTDSLGDTDLTSSMAKLTDLDAATLSSSLLNATNTSSGDQSLSDAAQRELDRAQDLLERAKAGAPTLNLSGLNL